MDIPCPNDTNQHRGGTLSQAHSGYLSHYGFVIKACHHQPPPLSSQQLLKECWVLIEGQQRGRGRGSILFVICQIGQDLSCCSAGTLKLLCAEEHNFSYHGPSQSFSGWMCPHPELKIKLLASLWEVCLCMRFPTCILREKIYGEVKANHPAGADGAVRIFLAWAQETESRWVLFGPQRGFL